ncbi:MAG: delta-class carbonic anhydrase, partial [Pseudomonadota bacterium]
MTFSTRSLFLGGLFVSLAAPAFAQELCTGYGPQTPRDIASVAGANAQNFPIAPASNTMNLCNIHTHTNAEHKGPGFSIFAGASDNGGYKCNETESLTDAELAAPEGEPAFGGAMPGDTIEVHWVHSSCQITPGPGLGSCLSDSCANPTLRVEAQVLLVVNDDSALDINDFAYDGNIVNGLHQPKALPSDTGEPIVFLGSTTGPSYTEAKCSPLQVTWSVRPQCAKVSYSSLQE